MNLITEMSMPLWPAEYKRLVSGEECKIEAKEAIKELLERGEESADDIDLRGLFLGKTPGKQATVKFGYDGSVWPLPNEFGFAAAD